jgi:hypothetical protein
MSSVAILGQFVEDGLPVTLEGFQRLFEQAQH